MTAVKTSIPKRATFTGRLLQADRVNGVATLALISLVIFLSLHRLNPPARSDSNAPLTEFSSARAMEHIKPISEKPRPLGSAAHALTRDYIQAQLARTGLSPQVQTATAVNSTWGSPARAGTVENIIARLDGTANTRAIMLVGHYDSVPNSFGASDDGAAVAALLETSRALRAGPRLKNDVIFLFTDGEERGLLGAQAFVDEHPWAKDVGLVFNFEARGNCGPSIMFETSDENGWLVKEFAKAALRPTANSLSYEIYKLLPNDTDFTVFRKAGMSGFNFAYIEGLAYYHSSLDSLGTIDERSVQHHGLYALALARHFGDLSYESARAGSAVYFDFLNLTLVHYSTVAAFALSVIVVLLGAGMVVVGFRKGLLTVSGIAKGFLALLMSALGSVVLVMLLAKAIALIQGMSQSAGGGGRYHDGLYMTAFAAFTIAFTAALYSRLLKKVGAEDLCLGGLLWHLVLMILSVLYVPGGSYLLTWPLLFALLGMGYRFAVAGRPAPSVLDGVVIFLATAPTIALVAPMIFQVFVAMGLNMASVVVAMIALTLGLLVKAFHVIGSLNRWLLPLGGSLAGVGLIVAAFLQPHFDETRPKLDNLFYVFNADSGRAVWASTDNRPDEWTSQFLSEGVQKGPLSEYLPQSDGNNFLSRQAPVAMLTAPEIKVLDDKLDDGARSVRMRVVSPRHASAIAVFIEAEVSDAWVNSKPIRRRETAADASSAGSWTLIYWAPPLEGIELKLRTKPSGPFKVWVVDQSYQLPELPGAPSLERPSYIKPLPFSDSDSTFVSRTYSFGPPS